MLQRAWSHIVQYVDLIKNNQENARLVGAAFQDLRDYLDQEEKSLVRSMREESDMLSGRMTGLLGHLCDRDDKLLYTPINTEMVSESVVETQIENMLASGRVVLVDMDQMLRQEDGVQSTFTKVSFTFDVDIIDALKEYIRQLYDTDHEFIKKNISVNGVDSRQQKEDDIPMTDDNSKAMAKTKAVQQIYCIGGDTQHKCTHIYSVEGNRWSKGPEMTTKRQLLARFDTTTHATESLKDPGLPSFGAQILHLNNTLYVIGGSNLINKISTINLDTLMVEPFVDVPLPQGALVSLSCHDGQDYIYVVSDRLHLQRISIRTKAVVHLTPIPSATIACYRSNLVYDAHLHRIYLIHRVISFYFDIASNSGQK
eukprot:gene13625-16037_t